MNAHKNARTTPFGRAVMVRRVLEDGWTVAAAAGAFAVSTRTVREWLARVRSDGAPAAEPQLGAAPGRQQAAGTLGRYDRPAAPRLPDDRGGHRRASPPATQHRRRSSRPLRPGPAGAVGAERAGAALQPRTRRRARPLRYQEACPLPARGHRITGDRRHGSDGAGWEFVHVAVDDASRLAFVEVLPDEKRQSVTGFLVRALRWFNVSAFGSSA